MRRSSFALMLFSLSAATHAASPQISVGTLFDYMDPGRSQLRKVVRNSGDATAYVRVDITRITYDSAGEVTETPVDTAALARSTPGSSGLIASPGRMIIPANNGQQATRLVFRGVRDSEQYFRVRYVPVVPDTDDFSLDAQQSDAYRHSVSAGVNVFTGYGTVVFVPPAAARYDTHIDASRVHNQGNATVVLDNLRRCALARPDDCDKGTKVHVRPGNSRMLDSTPGHYLRYDLIEGSARRSIDTRIDTRS